MEDITNNMGEIWEVIETAQTHLKDGEMELIKLLDHNEATPELRDTIYSLGAAINEVRRRLTSPYDKFPQKFTF